MNDDAIFYVEHASGDILAIEEVVCWEYVCPLCGSIVGICKARFPSESRPKWGRLRDIRIDPEPIGVNMGKPLYRQHSLDVCRAVCRARRAKPGKGISKKEKLQRLLQGEWPPKEKI